jgi:hypothetical protein
VKTFSNNKFCTTPKIVIITSIFEMPKNEKTINTPIVNKQRMRPQNVNRNEAYIDQNLFFLKMEALKQANFFLLFFSDFFDIYCGLRLTERKAWSKKCELQNVIKAYSNCSTKTEARHLRRRRQDANTECQDVGHRSYLKSKLVIFWTLRTYCYWRSCFTDHSLHYFDGICTEARVFSPGVNK